MPNGGMGKKEKTKKQTWGKKRGWPREKEPKKWGPKKNPNVPKCRPTSKNEVNGPNLGDIERWKNHNWHYGKGHRECNGSSKNEEKVLRKTRLTIEILLEERGRIGKRFRYKIILQPTRIAKWGLKNQERRRAGVKELQI